MWYSLTKEWENLVKMAVGRLIFPNKCMNVDMLKIFMHAHGKFVIIRLNLTKMNLLCIYRKAVCLQRCCIKLFMMKRLIQIVSGKTACRAVFPN